MFHWIHTNTDLDHPSTRLEQQIDIGILIKCMYYTHEIVLFGVKFPIILSRGRAYNIDSSKYIAKIEHFFVILEQTVQI